MRELDGSVRFLHVSHGDEPRALQFLFGAGKGLRRLGELRSRGRLFLRDSKESGTYRPHARVEGHRSELQGILVPSQILTMVRHRVPRPATRADVAAHADVKLSTGRALELLRFSAHPRRRVSEKVPTILVSLTRAAAEPPSVRRDAG